MKSSAIFWPANHAMGRARRLRMKLVRSLVTGGGLSVIPSGHGITPRIEFPGATYNRGFCTVGRVQPSAKEATRVAGRGGVGIQ